ncbi:MAG: HAD hydrolase-like protein [Deltaproteobacteria bacterium]|nr:HAD hydrolase-like protein [Deltaproteobacteria bacterium]
MDDNKIRLFLFDIDGTLIDAGGAGRRSIEKAFLKIYGVDRAFNGEKFTGRTDPAIFRTAYKKHFSGEPSKEEIRVFFDAYLDFLETEVALSENYKVLKGVREALDFLSARKDVLLGLSTGNIEAGGRIKLERGGLNRYFRFGGFGSDSEERVALTSAAIERASEILGWAIDRKNIYVIGDSPHDVNAANALSVNSVAVASGWSAADELMECRPAYFIPDMGALVSAINFF